MNEVLNELLRWREFRIKESGFEPVIKEYKKYIFTDEFVKKFGNCNIDRVFNECLKVAGKWGV